MSGKVGFIVQARMSSSRLPGKSLRKIGRYPLIYYIVQRLISTELPVIICTSTHTSDDILCEYLKSRGWNYHRGSLGNVLQRYIETAEVFEVEKIIRVTGDNPLVDIDYLEKSLPLFEDHTYVDGIYPGGLIKGTGFEFVSLSELKAIPSTQKHHQEHVTNWLRENLDLSESRIRLRSDEINRYRNDIFLTCDYQEDLDLLRNIFDYFDFKFDVPVRDVVQFLAETPSLTEINKDCHV